ncbi:MAG: hypothetical protein L0Z68_06530 [Gammaproteobacteria bacterium]|nr:hypothetical protein [Gammaproteobacteria bacterium]
MIVVVAVGLLGLGIYYAFLSRQENIVCNRFELKPVLVGNTLVMSIETDLPNHTDIDIQVSRAYQRNYPTGEPESAVADYYRERSIVGQWRTARRISINTVKWQDDVKKQQRKDEQAGLGRFKIEKVSAQIELAVTVSIDQSDPRFGERNMNLMGKAVSKTTSGRLVRANVQFDYPMEES